MKLSLRESVRLFVAVAASLHVSLGSMAAPTTFTFESQLTFVSPALSDAFDVGDLISGRFTFENSTPDSNAGPNIGTYIAVTNFSLTSGPHIFSATAPTAKVEVWNASGSARDHFFSSGPLSSASAISGFTATAWEFSIIGLSSTTFDSTDLPAQPPSLATAQIADLEILYEHPDGPGGSIVGTLNSLGLAAPIPEPEAYALMLVGVGIVACSSRQRKKV